MEHHDTTPKTFGIAAQFGSPEAVIEAANKAREEGFVKVEAYTPFPVHGLTDALGYQNATVKWIIFIAGLCGSFVGLGLQYWVSAVAYPHNAGGKPLFSWPSFIPVMFECTVLFASFGAVIGMLALNGLPKPYNSMFNLAAFERASRDKFFLCIEADDPKFDTSETRRFLEGLSPESVDEVKA